MSLEVIECHRVSSGVTGVIGCHQVSSAVTRCHRVSSSVIRHQGVSMGVMERHQSSLVVTRRQWASWGVYRRVGVSTGVTRCHQLSSEVIGYHRRFHRVPSGCWAPYYLLLMPNYFHSSAIFKRFRPQCSVCSPPSFHVQGQPSQCPRVDLNKKSFLRPKTATA